LAGGAASAAPVRPASAADVGVVVRAHKVARIEADNARLRELLAAIEQKNADGELELQLMRQTVSRMGSSGGITSKPSELDKAVASCESQATISVLTNASTSIPAGITL
jgi:DNA helicase HerA-like ATPase